MTKKTQAQRNAERDALHASWERADAEKHRLSQRPLWLKIAESDASDDVKEILHEIESRLSPREND